MALGKLLYDILRITRPRQWIKNGAVYAAIIFSGDLSNSFKLWPVTTTFIAFCMLSSGLYIINDIVDRDKDRLHYSKRFRPIAHGDISPTFALVLALLLLILGLYLITAINSLYVLVLALVFIAFQITYSLLFKKIILIDVIAIATGFMMRIFAGSFAVGVSLSSWLILSVAMLALFLAIGKRRLELTLMEHQTAVKHRDILSHYPTILLDGMTFMMATSTLLTYSLFTFNETQNPARKITLDFLPGTLSSPKWLMITIPIVIYGIFRYLYIIYEKRQGDSPERVLFSDLPLLSSIIIWGTTVLWVVYVLGK